MSDLYDLLLTGVLDYGSALLGVLLFLAALGLPLPANMLLVAAGAFAQQGVLSFSGALLAGIGGAVVGDLASYLLARSSVRLVPPALLLSPAWRKAGRLFERWGGWGVFITRFALTPAALPVNLLAGSTGYAWPRFVAAVVPGETTWVLLYGGVGHLFADRWAALTEWAGTAVGLLVGAVMLAIGVRTLWTGWGRRQAAGAASADPSR